MSTLISLYESLRYLADSDGICAWLARDMHGAHQLRALFDLIFGPLFRWGG